MDRGNEVINLYISLVEKIASGKNNILNFGSEEMTFYRGEIHILKAIGDSPGIFSSEVSRHMGVTRAVIHKTLLKLETRGLVEKVEDNEDKKIKKLFLTEKGEEAYNLHREYHEEIDKEFFQYLDNLSKDEEKILKEFLSLANIMIEKHF